MYLFHENRHTINTAINRGVDRKIDSGVNCYTSPTPVLCQIVAGRAQSFKIKEKTIYFVDTLLATRNIEDLPKLPLHV